ncbi:MAG: branched-chain amino acid ABC transporter permease, partial [Nitrospirota bacterium]
MFLTFPVMVIRVNPVEKLIEWRWGNMFLIGAGSFALSFVWRYLIKKKDAGMKKTDTGEFFRTALPLHVLQEQRFRIPGLIAVAVFAVLFPVVFSAYQTNIMTTVLMYVVLGLGLNIVVGLAGLLDLGYVAFYAAGAYSYALLNHHYGISFWLALPVGAVTGAAFGLLLGFPVLRLRGDYLAIVTLGFGEIIRLVLENWNEFSFGPSGISNIPRPSF